MADVPLPKTVILGTKTAVSAFNDFCITLPKSFDHTTQGCVFGIFSYLAHQEDSRGHVLEYLCDLEEELLTGQQDPKLIEKFCEEMEELARAIWEEMVLFKIYTASGVCWYYPHSLIGFDLVLELTEDIDAVKEDFAEIAEDEANSM